MAGGKNLKLEAFKQRIEQSKVRRAQDFQERGTVSRKLSEELEESDLSAREKQEVLQRFSTQQDQYLREARKHAAVEDFQFLKVIGAGGFGIVRLCRKKDTGEVYALKQMHKADMVRRNHVRHIRAEKDALCSAQDDWIIRLHCTFQDDTFLYMVMDYLPGGDLMTHLQRKDTFSEHETRFYIAELVEAVDYIHSRLRCIHRDIKPDNIVFDAQGHIRLVDFGLCKYDSPPSNFGPGAEGADASPRRRRHLTHARAQSVCGTPDYMAPEAYLEVPCGRACDWWSVGIITFEMLFGGPPFSDADHNQEVTAARVRRWREHFELPDSPRVSEEACSLLRGLICDAEDRLVADGIRSHAFFAGLDFAGLRGMRPPIRPVVRGSLDTSNFDDFGSLDASYRASQGRRRQVNDPTFFAFHDYSFRRDLEAKKPSVAAAMRSTSTNATTGWKAHARLCRAVLALVPHICS